MDSHEILILGAGPGGLQLGYFLQRAGCDYRILEAAPRVGAFFRRLPRCRRLISFNKTQSLFDDPEIQLRWDWNSLLTEDGCLPFREFSRELYPHADDLVRYLEAFAQRGELAIETSTRIERIARGADGRFELTDARGVVRRARVLVVATGFSRPYVPDIPGIELAEGYEDAPVDPAAYEGQRVLILGKGNSALELADVALPTAALIHVASPTPIQLAWRTRHPGHVRAEHTRLLDMYQLKTLNGALDCHVRELRREGDEVVARVAYVHADGEAEELVYDRVLRCTGFGIDLSPYADGCRPATLLDGRLPAISGLWESTNVPDMFFVGTLMQGLDFKRSSSAFIDGYRYNARSLARHLLERYVGQPAPSVQLPARAEALCEHVLQRASRTSGLWTQFGYLCDLFVLEGGGADGGEARADDGADDSAEPGGGAPDAAVRVLEELPLAHVETLLPAHEQAWTLTFEWGSWEGDVFAIARHPRHERADTNVFLHPILRHWRRGELAATHHVLEDLFGVYSASGERGNVRRRGGRDMARYHREEHVEPLRAFFAAALGAGAASDAGDATG